jgi:hypothetical protein
MVYDFSWASDELNPSDVDALVNNFLKDPYSFLNLESPEWDETIYIDVEDVTDDD